MSLQRIVGFAGQEWYYAVQVEFEMNEKEQALAEQIRQETGAELQVKTQGPEDFEKLLRLGYATPFILSEQTDASVFYVLQEHSTATQIYTVATVDLPAEEAPAPFQSEDLFSKRQFSDFFFWEDSFALQPKLPHSTSRTTYLFNWEEPFQLLSVPPPRPA